MVCVPRSISRSRSWRSNPGRRVSTLSNKKKQPMRYEKRLRLQVARHRQCTSPRDTSRFARQRGDRPFRAGSVGGCFERDREWGTGVVPRCQNTANFLLWGFPNLCYDIRSSTFAPLVLHASPHHLRLPPGAPIRLGYQPPRHCSLLRPGS